MGKTFEHGRDEVAKLCDYFATNQAAFSAPGMKEAHIRQHLIDPFFRALGWDVGNAARVAPQYCEVVVEDSVDVDGRQKAPDYAFRVGTLAKFYVEAKKCGINLFADPGPAYQLRRYGWSAKAPVSILTDFEELGVYDCTARPRPSDKASHARILYYRFSEYPDRWRELWDIFSREAVWGGAFDQYAASKRKRGTSEVDVEFLKEIEGWRDALARNIALRNKDLSAEELNRAVQLTIDRIVFLRMAEDRGLEPDEQLLSLCGQTDVYQGYMKLCRKADDKYNSGLFHFQKEADVADAPDRVTPRLAVDNRVFRPILQSLYFAHGSPYEFKVLPVEILGTVYERFLGKVIRLTAGHQAKVEEKPEVRKAGGVYYTPKYVVDYIVKQTVGRQVEGKSPEQIIGKGKARATRVLDMACGSGSFLLGAYQFLLDHCLQWYLNNAPESFPQAIYVSRDGDWRLTIAEKKRILLACIFGVDIDPQAVEVTKLSLLLKVLEGESAETLGETMRLFHERALPNLADNIKCGNSLIGPDYFAGRLPLGAEEHGRINAFDWGHAFPEALKAGGFQCIIGNPPYIPIELMAEGEREYYQRRFGHLSGKYDSSVIFALAGLEKVARGGRLGFISSVTWQTGENYKELRRHIFDVGGLELLLNLPFDVFRAAYVDTGVYVLVPGNPASFGIYRFPKKERHPNLESVPLTQVPTASVKAPDYRVILDTEAERILGRVHSAVGFMTLGELTMSTQGLAANRFDRASAPRDGQWYPFLEKGQVYRYCFQAERVTYVDMREHQSLRRFYDPAPKILIRRVINREDRLMATVTNDKMVFKKDINPFVLTQVDDDPHYILAIINSRLFSYIYVNTSSIATKDDFRQTTLAELRRMPLPKFEPRRRQHAEIAGLGAAMLALHAQASAARSDGLRCAIGRQIKATDRAIDDLVYELYGLTADEVSVVEGTTA